MRAEENDTDLLQQTSLCKKYWRMSLPWFTRRVAGKKVKVPGHFAFDDQADRYDDIARKCPHFLSSYGKLRGIARTISPHRRGLGIAINKWQKNSIEQTFCHVANRCRLFRQLPQEMLSFANIRRAVLTCLKLHNFINKEKHQKNVVESVAFAAALDVSKPRGQASIRRILRKQGMYKDASYAGTVEYEPIVKKRLWAETSFEFDPFTDWVAERGGGRRFTIERNLKCSPKFGLKWMRNFTSLR